jgi:hypothetical protein
MSTFWPGDKHNPMTKDSTVKHSCVEALGKMLRGLSPAGNTSGCVTCSHVDLGG